jgi:hypothetical protein
VLLVWFARAELLLSSMNATEVIGAIEDAWREVPYPGDKKIFRPDSYDDGDILNYFAGTTWRGAVGAILDYPAPRCCRLLPFQIEQFGTVLTLNAKHFASWKALPDEISSGWRQRALGRWGLSRLIPDALLA